MVRLLLGDKKNTLRVSQSYCGVADKNPHSTLAILSNKVHTNWRLTNWRLPRAKDSRGQLEATGEEGDS